MLASLPLLDLFHRLREHGLPLGVQEYQAVLQAMHAGVGLEDYAALARLCHTVWTNSPDEARLFHRLFDEMLATLPIPTDEIQPHIEAPSPEPVEQSEPEIEEPKPTPLSRKSSPSQPAPPRPTTEMDDPAQVVQAIRRSAPRDERIPRPRFALLTEYFPVTRRQMKQSWRHMRRSVREGPPEVLDIRATVEKISREGILLDPVLVPRRINRAELVLLLDQGGSMVPFHILTRQLLETLRRGGRLGQAGAYYFHDYPAGYLYRDVARVEAVSLGDALNEIGERAVVLIVSDAGAARGTFDQERVDRTCEFVTRLKQAVRRCAWLNPMPHTRWAESSAGQIAQCLPMFEMSRRGLDAAISVLRGRYAYGEKIRI
jgi:uncharacterized protein